jgi:hypothetical protein
MAHTLKKWATKRSVKKNRRHFRFYNRSLYPSRPHQFSVYSIEHTALMWKQWYIWSAEEEVKVTDRKEGLDSSLAERFISGSHRTWYRDCNAHWIFENPHLSWATTGDNETCIDPAGATLPTVLRHSHCRRSFWSIRRGKNYFVFARLPSSVHTIPKHEANAQEAVLPIGQVSEETQDTLN